MEIQADQEIWGMVETFDPRELTGWVNLAKGAHSRDVLLCVNGVQVQKIRTAGPIERDLPFPVHRFSLRMNSLWAYVGPTDQISVRVGELDLHIAGHGRFYTPLTTGDNPTTLLFDKLKDNHVFNQKGSLQLSKTVDIKWQRRTFKLYDKVREHLKDHFSVELVAIYGTLLGAVRSGQFIGHDHDFDVGFVSRFSQPEEVRREAVQIAEHLIDSGYTLTVKPSCIYVRHPSVPRAQIDVGRLFIGADGKLQTAFGFAGTAEYEASDFTGVEPIKLGRHTVYTLSNPQKLLKCIYGDDWRVPNSGFNWDRERRRITKAARLSREEIDWILGYQARHAEARAAEAALETEDEAV